MPEFWFGILMLMAFARGGRTRSRRCSRPAGIESPASDLSGIAHIVDVLNHLVLPLFVLTVAYLGEYAIIMRNSLIDIMGDDFIQTARAKGVREKKVLWRHAVPNAMLPTLTLTILSLGFVFSGAITVEYVFSYEGLGSLTVQAIEARTTRCSRGCSCCSRAAVIVANLVADILYSYLDPRVRAA